MCVPAPGRPEAGTHISRCEANTVLA